MRSCVLVLYIATHKIEILFAAIATNLILYLLKKTLKLLKRKYIYISNVNN